MISQVLAPLCFALLAHVASMIPRAARITSSGSSGLSRAARKLDHAYIYVRSFDRSFGRSLVCVVVQAYEQKRPARQKMGIGMQNSRQSCAQKKGSPIKASPQLIKEWPAIARSVSDQCGSFRRYHDAPTKDRSRIRPQVSRAYPLLEYCHESRTMIDTWDSCPYRRLLA